MADFFQITRTQFTVAQYIGWMRSGELELSPNFQRRSVWKAPAKSYFIDTVARGLPIPIIFLRERTDLNTLRTIREVVDGQQRLRTLFTYLVPELLSDFKEERDSFLVRRIHNKQLEGKKFIDLPQQVKEHLLSYQISTHVLPSSTSDSEVLDMFRRMNATGTKLNAQELRNAEFFGQFSQTSKAVSSKYLDIWRLWNMFHEPDFARMREVEFVSELLMVAESGMQEKTQSRITNYYKARDENYPFCDTAISMFDDIMEIISGVAGSYISRTSLSNQGVFYSLFATLLDMRYGAVEPLGRPVVAKDLPTDLSNRMRGLSEALKDRDRLPQPVSEALNSRSNRLSNRRIIRDFIRARLAGEPAT